jgi:hypothetical protein
MVNITGRKEAPNDITTGLPDGKFSNQKIQIWVDFGVCCNERCWCILWPLGIHFGHLACFWPFGNLVVIRYICPHFGIFYQQKSGNPDHPRRSYKTHKCTQV